MHSKRAWQTHSSFLAWRIPWTGHGPWGHKQSDMTEVTEHTHLILRVFKNSYCIQDQYWQRIPEDKQGIHK